MRCKLEGKELWLTAETQEEALLLHDWANEGSVNVKGIGKTADGNVSITIPADLALTEYAE